MADAAFGIEKRAALGILACALTALVDLTALDLPFVFDDRTTILLNPSLVDLRDVRALLLHDPPRAVANLSYAVDRAFWGFSSFGFHVTNFVLHVLVVALFYGWCTRALADGVRPGSDRGQNPGVEWPAFFAAAAFGLHPLMGATAAYVSARAELLCALGTLTALMFARRAIVRSRVSAGVLATVFGALALGSSGAAAGLPLITLAYDAWVLRDPGWRRRLWRVYVPAMAAVGLMATWDLPAVLSADRVPPRGLLNNLLTEAIVTWRYLALLIVPAGQAIVHQVHWATSAADPLALLALAGLAAATVVAVRARHAAPVAAFGVIWFLASVVPTSMAPLRDAMAEPRAYVAGAGLLLASASLLARPLASRRAVRTAAAGVLVLLGVLTHVRNTVWGDPLQLWEESVRRSPDAWQAHLGYAETLREIEQCTRAIPEYEATLRLNPSRQDAVDGLRECRR
jgi:hypothetical protein